ncbi:MAG TPA: GGDEF domain-containing protein [Vicinamibacterales bacterium]|nr:GGDEF domain-containing protein [Vicinamibacterales bacterium]
MRNPMTSGTGYPHEANTPAQDDLRHRIATALRDRSAAIVADTVAIFPFSGAELLERRYCNRIGEVVVELQTMAVRDGTVDGRGGTVAALHRIAQERGLPAGRLFTFVYLLERSVLDELALSDAIGATSEAWPLVAQMVRRASFDLLAAYAERAQLAPSDSAIVDKLTTLHTRPLFDAVIAKELERAGRYGYPVSLILFDVDRLSAINQEHGYGVGDRILERLGILIRQYFRQHDWVARYADDAIAVLLSRTDVAPATDLAERVRATVEDRLEFTDHRTDRPVRVTLSAAVVNVAPRTGDVIDRERLFTDAESGVERAKQQGRNRVVRVDGYSGRQPTAAGVTADQPPYSSS